MDPKQAEGLLTSIVGIWDAVLSFTIAAFFGAVSYVNEVLFRKKPPEEAQPTTRVGWPLLLVVKATTAGCVGLLTLWGLVELELVRSQAGRAFVIAVAGWGGADTIQFFWEAGKDAVLRRAKGDSSRP